MRLVEKRGQQPRLTLEKSELVRMLESSYLLKRMGALLEDAELIELSANIRLQFDAHCGDWQLNEETGELTKPPKEQPVEAASTVKPPTKPGK